MRNYYYYDKLDSTMLEYQRLKEVNDLPLAVRAGTQKDGVGRANRIWLSPPGGLWFTLIMNIINLYLLLPYIWACIHQCLII